jgi:F-type H+-transporting ATPase subunit b
VLSRLTGIVLGLLLLFSLACALPAQAAEEHDDHGKSKAEQYDIGHGNATPNLEKPEQYNRYDLSIFTFVVFALLMALLWKFAWGPIAKGLDQREATIAKMIEDAKIAAEAASKSLKQYELKLAQAQEEAGRIIGDARRQGEELAIKLRADAEAAAEKQRQQAVSDIEQAKNTALREIAQRSVSTAVELAGKIIRREVKETDHQQLIRDSLERFSKN